MKPIKKIILIFFFFIPLVLAFDLSWYPDIFIDNGSIDTVLIVGDNADVDKTAALNIIVGLKLTEYYVGDSLDYDPGVLTFIHKMPLKKSSEIKNLYEKNVIIIGGPCANPVAARIMGSSSTWPKCAEGFKQDFAKIRLYNNYDRFQLLVAGYEAKDTIAASTTFINFTKYNWVGKEMEVNTYRPKNLVLRTIE